MSFKKNHSRYHFFVRAQMPHSIKNKTKHSSNVLERPINIRNNNIRTTHFSVSLF